MRRLFRSVVALVTLAVGLPGCGKSDEARTPVRPSSGDRAKDESNAALFEVTLVVPGMT